MSVTNWSMGMEPSRYCIATLFSSAVLPLYKMLCRFTHRRGSTVSRKNWICSALAD